MALAEIPAFPTGFWGTVTVNGVAVPTGAIVRVFDSEAELGSVTVQAGGVYGYSEPTKQKLIVGDGGTELTFTIEADTINGGVQTGGINPVTYLRAEAGETVHKDLSFTTTTVTNPSTSGGGGGSSRGGGGGSSRRAESTPEPVVEVLGIATSTPTSTIESELAQRMQMQKQIIQLLTQLIALLQQKLLLNAA